jgi:hypothetical protein
MHQLEFLGTDLVLLDLARPFGIFVTPQSLSNGRETKSFLVVLYHLASESQGQCYSHHWSNFAHQCTAYSLLRIAEQQQLQCCRGFYNPVILDLTRPCGIVQIPQNQGIHFHLTKERKSISENKHTSELNK